MYLIRYPKQDTFNITLLFPGYVHLLDKGFSHRIINSKKVLFISFIEQKTASPTLIAESQAYKIIQN